MRVNNQLITSQEGTALTALESAGFNVKSECRSGFCGACRLKASGEPIYLCEPIGYIDKGEILACCVDAASDINVELEPLNT